MIKILSPCGILGYGFPTSSFENGLALGVDAIIVDAGSTDAGPHKLGESKAIVSKESLYNDLYRILKASRDYDIPVIVGSAGGAGTNKNVLDTKILVEEIFEELEYYPKTAYIFTDIDKDLLKSKLSSNNIRPLSANTPDLNNQIIDSFCGVVGQISHDKVQEALEHDAKVIIAGRCYDPAIFAAFASFKGYDLALAYHMGKILECGAICAVPGSAKDCIIGELHFDHFNIVSLNPIRKVTKQSVAAHTFYEKDNPVVLHGPGTVLNLTNAKFEQVDTVVKVSGSKITEPAKTIKLEGSSLVGYRTIMIAGIRDEVLINQLEQVENEVLDVVSKMYQFKLGDDYRVNFLNYGINAILQSHEPSTTRSHEVCIIIDVVGKNRNISNAICSSLRSTLLHYGYENRRSTSGNLAFPFAPSDIEVGNVYEFSGYHLVDMTEDEFVKIQYEVYDEN